MRKSFGGSGSGSGSGNSSGGGNGGDMLRSVGRVVRTKLNNFQDYSSTLPSNNNYNDITQKTTTNSSSMTNNTQNATSKQALLSLSSSNTNTNTLVPAAWPWPPSSDYFVSSLSSYNDGVSNEGDGNDHKVDDDKWECFENYYDPIFGVVPSTHEVQHALYSLQQVVDPQSSSTKEKPSEVDNDMDEQTRRSDAGSSSTLLLQRPSSSSKSSDNSDWLEPTMHPAYDWKLTQSPGWGAVHDAFHLLQNDPTVQRMVVSLSSDKAVWDAVLNNEAVRDIRDSYRNAAESFPPSSDEQLHPSKADSNILKWVFENVKMKLLEVLGNISRIVGDMFMQPLDCDKEEQSYMFIEKLNSTFLLTIVVLLIVVVARGQMAS